MAEQNMLNEKKYYLHEIAKDPGKSFFLIQ